MEHLGIGRIIFEGTDVEPLRLLDLNGSIMVEIVDGQYRVEMLEGEKSALSHEEESRGA